MTVNRIALITGATAGMGEAVARDFVAQGIKIIANGRRKERLEKLAAELNRDEKMVEIVAGDASDPQVIKTFFEVSSTSFSANPDLVVANAGRGLAGSIITSDDSQWREVVETNLMGMLRLLRAAASKMLEGIGDQVKMDKAHDIVVLGSTVGRHISPFSSVYGSTKFAVNSLAEALRREIGPRGIRVTLIEPGIVKSEFQGVAGYDQEWFSGFADRIKPLIVPEDVSRLVSFIVSQPPHVHINDVVIRPTRQEYP
jgi:NADP-dependent 3-hydroxy acid dehydrogenase YdfG